MAKILFLFFSFIFFFSFSLSSFTHPSSLTFPKTLEILSSSNYLSMALTLQLISRTHMSSFSNITIFAPSDTSFFQSGQMSLRQLQYHILPIRLSMEDLKALPYGSKITTLQPGNQLTVTCSNSNDIMVINNVKIDPIFDDGSVAIYGIGHFFDSYVAKPPSLCPENISNPQHKPEIAKSSFGAGLNFLVMASEMLKSEGYAKIGTFLDLQLIGLDGNTNLTIFAPLDESIDPYVKNFNDYSLIFRKHVVPELVTWKDLISLDDEQQTTLATFSAGFMINVVKSGDVLVLNGVAIIRPDMHKSDSIVVHGIRQLLIPALTKQDPIGDSFSELNGNEESSSSSSLDYGEY